MRVPDEGPYFGTWHNAVCVLDLDTGERRSATSEDLGRFVRLVDGLENYAWTKTMLTPQDVPKEMGYLHSWAITFQNTDKHIMGVGPGPKGVDILLEIGSVIAGSLEDLRKKPFLSFSILTRPPLMWSDWALGALLRAAKNGIPVCLGAGPIAGATGPVTLAGTLTQAHAEILAGIVVAQLVNPGAPIIYNSSCRVLDMATGNVSMCSPEWFLFKVSLRQLARFLKIPIWTGGAITNAKIPDAQAGYEQGISGLAGALGGDFVACGSLETGEIMDRSDLVIGDEISSMVNRILRGFEINPETLALDVIDQVGPGGEYLGVKHTLKHFRNEIWRPVLSDRSTWSSWVSGGRKDTWQRAKERAKKILAEHEPHPLPRDQQKEIENILARAAFLKEV